MKDVTREKKKKLERGNTMKNLLSCSDVGKRLGVTPATVRLLERQGRLPAAFKTEGGMRLFDAKDVEKIAEERAQRKESA